MSIKKKHLKSKPICKVTFKVPRSLANGAQHITLAGDFNNWDPGATPMKGLKSGEFTATLDLETGREYQFRYVIDGESWVSEPEADKQVPNPFGDGQNSVLVIDKAIQ